MGIEEFREVVEEIPELSADDPQEFESEVISRIVQALDYNLDNLYFEVTYRPEEGLLIADAAVSSAIDNRPYLVFEVKNYWDISDENRLTHLTRDASEANFGVIITNNRISVVERDGGGSNYEYNDLEDIHIDYLYEQLKAPEQLPEDNLPSSSEKQEAVDDYKFSNWISSAVDDVERATTNDEKKNSLEGLSEGIFERIDFLRVRDRNVLTGTGNAEFDLIVEYLGSDGRTVFDHFDPFIIVECKNWKDPVASKHLRDIRQKMSDKGVDLGILIAKKGITGESGTAAQWERDAAFHRDRQAILVLRLTDLKSISSGSEFCELLDKKFFRLRFGS